MIKHKWEFSDSRLNQIAEGLDCFNCDGREAIARTYCTLLGREPEMRRVEIAEDGDGELGRKITRVKTWNGFERLP